jgi:lysophospholipase
MAKQSMNRRQLPASARILEWRAPDGWSHRRLDWPQPAGKKARGTLLFAGGRGDFIEKYLEALAHWHGEGWAVAAFDWRGQGGSRGGIENGHLDSLDILVDDLAALVGELRSSGPGPHVVIGHSMGGHVLLRAIAEGKAELDSAVLVAPMLGINTGPLPNWAAGWMSAAMAGFGWNRAPVWRAPLAETRRIALTSSRERYEDELWWWKKEPDFRLSAPSWGWLDAAYRSCAWLSEARLRAVGTPLLLIGSETDRLVSAAAIRRAARLVPSARLKMFAKAGHELLREADPVRLEALAEIDTFLAEKAPQR